VSDSDSSSLEIHEHPPHYDDLVASIQSDGDEHPDVANTTLAHMEVDGQPEHSERRGAEWTRHPQPPMTLEEQVPDGGATILQVRSTSRDRHGISPDFPAGWCVPGRRRPTI
jgi:hypothetical protein